MAAPRITLKKNDRLPTIVATVTNPDGSPVDLSAASEVKFSMRDEFSGELKIDSAMASFTGDRTTGIVQYAWADGDTDTPSEYAGEFKVFWPMDKPQSAPQPTNILITILPATG